MLVVGGCGCGVHVFIIHTYVWYGCISVYMSLYICMYVHISTVLSSMFVLIFYSCSLSHSKVKN